MTTPTLSQLGEMTDEELNVRLAELLGWIDVEICAVTGNVSGFIGDSWADARFTSDANAVAEVRKGMTKEQQRRFSETLKEVLENWTQYGWDRDFQLIDAKPRPQTISAIHALTP